MYVLVRREAMRILREVGFRHLEGLSDDQIAERLRMVAEGDLPKTVRTSAVTQDVEVQKPKQRGSKPGVCATIVEMLRSGSEDKPVTLDKLVKVLSRKFPDRDPDGMRETARRLTYWIPRNHDEDVVRSGDGYYIPHD